jgi:hypothetical protein
MFLGTAEKMLLLGGMLAMLLMLFALVKEEGQ